MTRQLGYSLSRTEHEGGGEVADLKSYLAKVINGDARASQWLIPALCNRNTLAPDTGRLFGADPPWSFKALPWRLPRAVEAN